MAQITITVPDAAVTRINTAFAATFGYDPNGGQTQTQFTKSIIISSIKRVVKDYEGAIEAAQARAVVDSSVDSVNIT